MKNSAFCRNAIQETERERIGLLHGLLLTFARRSFHHWPLSFCWRLIFFILLEVFSCIACRCIYVCLTGSLRFDDGPMILFVSFLLPFCGHAVTKGTKIGSCWGDVGPFFGRSGVILVSQGDHFGIVLVLFWPHFEAFVGSFFFWWWCFGKLTAKLSKMV